MELKDEENGDIKKDESEGGFRKLKRPLQFKNGAKINLDSAVLSTQYAARFLCPLQTQVLADQEDWEKTWGAAD